MRKHFKIVVEYPPNIPVHQREDVDRQQMERLKKEHPNATIVNMARRFVSDYRAHLYAVLEWK